MKWTLRLRHQFETSARGVGPHSSVAFNNSEFAISIESKPSNLSLNTSGMTIAVSGDVSHRLRREVGPQVVELKASENSWQKKISAIDLAELNRTTFVV